MEDMEDNMGLLSLSQREIENGIEKIKNNPEAYFSLNKRCRRNSQILSTFLMKSPEMYYSMSAEDKKFVTVDMVLRLIRYYGCDMCILNIFNDFSSNEKVCLEAVKHSPKNVRHINSNPEVFKKIMLYIIANIRLSVKRDKDPYDALRRDKYQYVYYIPEEYIDEELRTAIEKSIIRNLELDKILFDIGYGNGVTY